MNYRIPDGIFYVIVLYHTTNLHVFTTVFIIDCHQEFLRGYYSRPIEGVNSNLRSPMLNSLREWGERRSTRVFALKIAQKRLEFEGVCTVTCVQHPLTSFSPRQFSFSFSFFFFILRY